MFRKMVLLIFVAGSLFAQPKAIHFKKLQEFLPAIELENFVRKKPTGSTQTTMGFTSSFAEVQYEENIPENVENFQQRRINIKITDASLYPAMLMGFMMLSDYESEDENGIEKSTWVKEKYKGILKIQNGEYKSVNLSFAVVNRFLVEIEAENTDSEELIQKLIDNIDFAKLEVLQP